MLVTSSRHLTRRYAAPSASRLSQSQAARRPLFTSSSCGTGATARFGGVGTAVAVVTLATAAACYQDDHFASLAAAYPTSGDVVMVGSPTAEKATGILFSPLCNGLSLVGTGVRIKYVFVKVYAVGTYMDPIAMMAVKKSSKADIVSALKNPSYPRTIRIVMNRGLSIDKYTAGIVESLEPRMKGQDLDK
jgi:hypothetical protein